MFDISSVNALSQGGNQFWLLIIDDYTNYCWSFFLPHEDDLPQVMLQWLKQVTPNIRLKLNVLGVIMLVKTRVFNHY